MDRPPLRFNRQVLSELQSIFDFIKADSPDRAAGMIAEILDGLELLRESPIRHKVVGRSQRHDSLVHRVVIGKYLAYYWIDSSDDRVNLITIRHGARRQPKRFE